MKKMRVLAKVSLLALTFLVWSSTVFSQSKIPVESITTEWSFFQEVKGVKFYAKKDFYRSKGRLDVEYLLIKLENASNKDLNVSYKPVIYYDKGCNGCTSDEYLRSLTLPANSTVEGKLSEGSYLTTIVLYDPNAKEVWIPKSILTQNLIIK